MSLVRYQFELSGIEIQVNKESKSKLVELILIDASLNRMPRVCWIHQT